MKKILYLDGLRTVFCSVVVIHHFLQVFYPSFPQILFNDGNMAVLYFLMLTGFVTPLQIFAKKEFTKFHIIRYSVLRYLRLLPVVFVTIMGAYILQQAGALRTQETAVAFDLDKIRNYYRSSCSFTSAIWDGIIGAFFFQPELNPPLWTISYEMWGGILVYITATVLRKIRYRRILILLMSIVSAFVLHNIYIAALLTGFLFSDILHNKNTVFWFEQSICLLIKHPRMRVIYLFLIILIASGLVLNIGTAIYLRYVFIALLFLFLSSENNITRWLGNKTLTYLSSYTYAIYATHWPILCSFACMAALVLPVDIYCIRVIVAFCVMVILTVSTSFLLRKYIEMPFHKAISAVWN